MASRPVVTHPRSFPSSGFARIDPANKIEDEELPGYVPEHYYYPAALGEVFNSQYQVWNLVNCLAMPRSFAKGGSRMPLIGSIHI
jgi:hypothetical protein